MVRGGPKTSAQFFGKEVRMKICLDSQSPCRGVDLVNVEPDSKLTTGSVTSYPIRPRQSGTQRPGLAGRTIYAGHHQFGPRAVSAMVIQFIFSWSSRSTRCGRSSLVRGAQSNLYPPFRSLPVRGATSPIRYDQTMSAPSPSGAVGAAVDQPEEV